MFENYHGPLEMAVNEKLEDCTCVVLDFQDGKVPDRDELLRLIGAVDFMADAGVIYQDLYDMISSDLDMVLAACAAPAAPGEAVNVCCICGKEFSGHGHSPHPIKSDGVCCEACNVQVIAARIALVKNS